jgi:bla regulator protein BlaR1
MEFFEASGNWTVALGKTMVHSLWIGLLLLSVLKITLQVLPGRYSLLRYRLTTGSLFLFIGTVVALFIFLYAPMQTQLGMNQPALQIPVLVPFIQGLSVHSGNSPVMLICTICCYIYFAGILFMFIRSILSFSVIRQMKRNGVLVQHEWYDRFLHLKYSLGIRKRVTLLESESLSVPALVGLFKPAIIVPVGMFTHLPADQVETILLHELHHLKRFDFLVNIMQSVVEGLFFYNPAVWTISQMIRTERENCCDDRVIQSCGDPIVYARALFQLAGHHQPFNNLMPGAGGTDQFQLFNRIKRILNQTTMKTNIREKLFSLMLLAGAMIILFTVSGFSSGFSIIRHHDSRMDEEPSRNTSSVLPMQKPVLVLDTIPAPDPVPEAVPEPEQLTEKEKEEIKKEIQAAKEAIAEIDWEAIEMEIQAAKEEALSEIDWEEMKKEVEAAKVEALESIDWEEIKKEMEAARLEAMESIDWEEIQKDIANTKIDIDSMMQEMDFDLDFDFDFDMDELMNDLEESMREIENIDLEAMHRDIEKSMQEIDFEEIRLGMENMKIHMDSISHSIDDY